jgi:RNA polymerase subunit RPABC4/transcription elongation factor Spt4
VSLNPQVQHAVPAPGDIACPRCGALVGSEQDWCLTCGAPARTRLAPTPNWRLPVAIVATVAAVALIALAVAFVQLTRNDNGVVDQSGATTPKTTAGATTPPPVATLPGTVTQPPAGTASTPAGTTTQGGAGTTTGTTTQTETGTTTQSGTGTTTQTGTGTTTQSGTGTTTQSGTGPPTAPQP